MMKNGEKFCSLDTCQLILFRPKCVTRHFNLIDIEIGVHII